MQYQNSLNNIIGAVKIISPNVFSFAGKTFTTDTNNFYSYHGSTMIDPLVRSMTDIIYQQCYCRKFNGNYYELTPVTEDNRAFLAALSNANSTTEKWDKDWVIEQIMPTGQYVVRKNGKYKLLYPGEFITKEHSPALPHEGTSVIIHCLKESLSFQPAFYFVFSNEINDQQNIFTVIRFYWNIKSTGAAGLIELITKNLNKYCVPFLFKCLNNPALFTRSDAAVLYVSKPYYNITVQILAAIYPYIKDELNIDVPGFTKKLSSGLSLAEDPATGESFGMSRCGLIAQGIYNAYQSGIIECEKIMEYIQKVFNEKGIQIIRPYLNAGSSDVYEFTD